MYVSIHRQAVSTGGGKVKLKNTMLNPIAMDYFLLTVQGIIFYNVRSKGQTKLNKRRRGGCTASYDHASFPNGHSPRLELPQPNPNYIPTSLTERKSSGIQLWQNDTTCQTHWPGRSSWKRFCFRTLFFYGNVDISTYLCMLNNFVFPQVASHFNNHHWEERFRDLRWVKDGAPAHRLLEVRERLNETSMRIVSLVQAIMWPPHSPDLTSCDFFMSSYLRINFCPVHQRISRSSGKRA